MRLMWKMHLRHWNIENRKQIFQQQYKLRWRQLPYSLMFLKKSIPGIRENFPRPWSTAQQLLPKSSPLSLRVSLSRCVGFRLSLKYILFISEVLSLFLRLHYFFDFSLSWFSFFLRVQFSLTRFSLSLSLGFSHSGPLFLSLDSIFLRRGSFSLWIHSFPLSSTFFLYLDFFAMSLSAGSLSLHPYLSSSFPLLSSGSLSSSLLFLWIIPLCVSISLSLSFFLCFLSVSVSDNTFFDLSFSLFSSSFRVLSFYKYPFSPSSVSADSFSLGLLSLSHWVPYLSGFCFSGFFRFTSTYIHPLSNFPAVCGNTFSLISLFSFFSSLSGFSLCPSSLSLPFSSFSRFSFSSEILSLFRQNFPLRWRHQFFD